MVASPELQTQPGGPGLHICIPWRLNGSVIPQAMCTQYSHLLRNAWATVGLFFSPVTTQGSYTCNVPIMFQSMALNYARDTISWHGKWTSVTVAHLIKMSLHVLITSAPGLC